MADRPEDAVALSEDDIEQMALEPSDHDLELANREENGSAEPADDELPRPTPRSQRKNAKRAPATRQKSKPAVTAQSTDETGTEDAPDAGSEATRQAEAADREEARMRAEEGLDLEEEPEPVAEPPKGKPFRFKASGAEQVFNGLEELEDGSFKGTPEAAQTLRTLLASHTELRRTSTEERRRLTRELNAAKNDRTAKDIEADKITGIFADLIGKKSEDEVFQWATDFLAKIPEYKAAIKEAQLEAREKALEARAKGPELLPEEQEEIRDRAIQGELQVTFQRLFKLPEAKFLTPEDRSWLQQKWAKRGNHLVQKQGTDEIFDDQDVVDDFIDRVKIRQQNANLLTARQRNEERNGDQDSRSANGAPPVVRGGRRPAEGGRPEKKPYGRGQKREFKKAFMQGTLDVNPDEG